MVYSYRVLNVVLFRELGSPSHIFSPTTSWLAQGSSIASASRFSAWKMLHQPDTQPRGVHWRRVWRKTSNRCGLSAAYDTVNHRLLLQKVLQHKDNKLVKLIESLLQNRRFYVSLDGKKSHWRSQKNGLPQGSVLSPLLFNIYTNDQPILLSAKHFIYADDLAIAVQSRTFETVENLLENALSEMSTYYLKNFLRPNPTKTQVCAFHLRSREARRKLTVKWEGCNIEHTEKPKYLGVTLDRSLTYKYHCENTAKKVDTRNNLLKKLCCSKWGANPNVLRTSARALCFSTAE